ncbi:MAG: putative DNA binding domain-containing protein, partial [Desulfovibrionaceae bacterium]|nr:putative DNA binding domain-containing protein [Desulfovibrionaceae bacterium]
MTMEEILAGESKNVEFKENLPEKSSKYMKTVVAFANGSGGKIIFGIADKTREVTGFEKEDVFRKMDDIANAVSDSCEPAIIPDITAQTIDGRTVIVVEVSEGRQRPYYIKSLGRERGVYVRVAGTTRIADEYMIKELLFEGSSRHFDQVLCTGLTVTDEEIDDLCKAMKAQAVQNAHSEDQKASVRDVGRQQLLSWGILIERDGKLYPSNAFAILTGRGGLHTATQCGVFKGSTKEYFVDRREYVGPLWEQLEEAYQYVLRNIHLG